MSDAPAWLNRIPTELSPQAFLLDAAVRTLHSAEEIGAFILENREEIRRGGLTGLQAAGRYSDVVDAALQRMLSLGLARHGQENAPHSSSGIAIVATGGYGRRELAPYSDIDVTFVPAREDDPEIDQVVRTLFQLLMDALVRTAQLKVGYAYRLTGDCGSLELQTQTSLIDSRFVAGDYRLFAEFREEMRRQVQPVRFVFDRAWEQAAAAASAGGTLYRVEPDLKNGLGGLREIQTATWLAQVRFGIWSPAVWEELIDRGVVSFRETQRLFQAMEFLHTVRNALHWRAQKPNNVLMMALQGDIADTLGFRGSETLSPSQDLMETYYGHAEHISSTAQRVMAWVLESRLELGNGLSCYRRRLECASTEEFLSRSSNVIWAYLQGQLLRIPFSRSLSQTVATAVQSAQAAPPDPESGRLLRQILESPEGVSLTLNAMARSGVLGWILPEFAPLLNLAPRDAAHEFTVGYHSLEVVRRLEEMRQDGSLGEVFRHLDYPAALFLAGLLHDSGKALGARQHSERGAEMVPAIGIRLEMQPQHVRQVQFLVGHHLLMSELARFRDLTRPESVQELTSVVPDQDSLDMLYLLTIADGQSVGKGIWSAVHGRFLEELHGRARQSLAYPAPEPGEEDLRRYQRRVTRALTEHNLSTDEVTRHVEAMPASYLLNTPSDVMALHIGMVRRALETGRPAASFIDDRADQFTELVVCAVDHPGLLAEIAGCLWSLDIFVHSAQVFTRRGEPDIALDTLWVDFHGRALDAQRKRRLELDLVDVLTGKRPVRDLLLSRGKARDLETPRQEPAVSAHRTREHLICEIRSGDQRGVLYRQANAISELGWDIQSARISGGYPRTRDVFYLVEPQGLDPEEAAALLRERLI